MSGIADNLDDVVDESPDGGGGELREGGGDESDAVADREVLKSAKQMRSTAEALIARRPAIDKRAKKAYAAEHERAFREEFARIPFRELKTVPGSGGFRLDYIEAAGYRTVADVRAAGQRRLESITGVGPATSEKALAAAGRIESDLRRRIRVRFDVDRRPGQQTALLAALRELERAQELLDPLLEPMGTLVTKMDPDLRSARLVTAGRIRRFFAGRRRKEHAQAAFERLVALLSDPATKRLHQAMETAKQDLSQESSADALWDDYVARAVTYNGLLIDVSGRGSDLGVSESLLPSTGRAPRRPGTGRAPRLPGIGRAPWRDGSLPEPDTAPEPEAADDFERSTGFLAQEIVDRIREFRLDTSLLCVTPRAYQSFGAKFVLVQRQVIIGDEMGLGKTIEALAVLAHLQAGGANHFLVVSPASVLANWEHEIDGHTRIRPIWRLHGPERDHMLSRWARQGGIAVTTFDTLGSLDLPDVAITAIVADEAHYVKNPKARRTLALRRWLQRAEYALLMTGTPMENRLDEFRTLVDHVDPSTARSIPETVWRSEVAAFRRSVAPVYLRRNQDDVIDELPEKIEAIEWLGLEGPAAAVYRTAVASGHFMHMRRAAFLTPNPMDSPKLSRLLEIVEEAVGNDRKVVVFSYFLDVIERVQAALGSSAVGPLTGKVPPTERQRLVDSFSAKPEPAVLISQIQAGGVGLNIQAASVVILAEPQWKPTIEEQAIARCHRLGQVRPVEVHRLLTENSVDEYMVEMLAHKSSLFDTFVRESVIKDAAGEAVDSRDYVSTAKGQGRTDNERLIIKLERKRLKLTDEESASNGHESAAEPAGSKSHT